MSGYHTPFAREEIVELAAAKHPPVGSRDAQIMWELIRRLKRRPRPAGETKVIPFPHTRASV